MRIAIYKEIDKIHPIAGISSILHELRNKVMGLHIVSSNSYKNIDYFLSHYELNFFDSIDSEMALFGKHRILSKLKKESEQAGRQFIYVGDEVRDLDCALRSGVEFYAVTWGLNTPHAFLQHGAQRIYNTPDELLTELMRMVE
jgi:phosphoglycolate phosphatase-like HAD superfamily hydrolase